MAARFGRVRFPGGLLTGLAASLLLFWGFWETRSLVNPVTVFADEADAAALNWIQVNTPLDARFLLNSTPWMGRIARGVDGGYWMTPVTGRGTLPPSAAYSWGAPGYIRQVEGWVERAANLEGCTPDFWRLVKETNLTHVYLKQGSGSLSTESFTGCAGIETVYNQDGVVILALHPVE